jgi:hypothetical protein
MFTIAFVEKDIIWPDKWILHHDNVPSHTAFGKTIFFLPRNPTVATSTVFSGMAKMHI